VAGLRELHQVIRTRSMQRSWLVLAQRVHLRDGRTDADGCATRWWPLGRQFSAMPCCETRAPIAQDRRREEG
jgi:hypothetical protein